METYEQYKTEHKPPRYEVFDPQASVRMLAEDIEMHGRVLPETMQQVYNEELTFVAESINAPLQTRFRLTTTAEGLVDERGTLLTNTLLRGKMAAEQAAARDARLDFTVRRAVHDYEEGLQIESMMRGETDTNTIVSVSPFAHEAFAQHGKTCLEDAGYKPDRTMAFIRIYNRLSHEELEVVSLSVDTSDLEAFQVLMKSMGVAIPPNTTSDDMLQYRAHLRLDAAGQAALPKQLIGTYDRILGGLYNQEFHAGRRKKDEVEAWSFIESQKTLVSHYFDKLEALARTDPYNRAAKKKLTYGFWAALNDRMKAAPEVVVRGYDNPALLAMALDTEMHNALKGASARHEPMVGCGGKIGIHETLLDESPENAAASIFGSSAGEEDKYGSLHFECPKGHPNKRPRNKLIDRCKTCKISVKC